MSQTKNLDTSTISQLLRELNESREKQNALLERLIDALTSVEGQTPQETATPTKELEESSSPSVEGDGGKDDRASIVFGDKFFDHFDPRRRGIHQDQIALYKPAEPNHEFTGGTKLPPHVDPAEVVAFEPGTGTTSPDWKYWVPVYTLTGASESSSSTGGNERILVYMKSEGGRPDLIPPWELREVNGQFYHVDDLHACHPIPGPHFNNSGEVLKFDVPYSHMPFMARGRFAASGMTVDWTDVQKSIGDLFSVPADNRLPLPFAFSKNELRLKCSAGEVDTYLRNARRFFSSLRDKGGTFYIYDFDTNMNALPYGLPGNDHPFLHPIRPRPSLNLNRTATYWKAAEPALFGEQMGFTVESTKISVLPPTECGKMWDKAPLWFEPKRSMTWEETLKQATTSPVIRWPNNMVEPAHGPWYRLVCFEGLSLVTGPGVTLQDVSRIVFGRDFSCPIQVRWSSRRAIPPPPSPHDIDRILESHMYCKRRSTDGNDFSSSWKQFHFTWFDIVSMGDGQPKTHWRGRPQNWKDSSWRFGPLYGDENLSLCERAFTVAIFPWCSREPRYQHEDWEARRTRVGDQLDFWTILLLVPPDSFAARHLHAGICPAAGILELIGAGLSEAVEAWEQVRNHLYDMLDDGGQILYPDRHDSLLFDDDTLARSRKYFWAMNSLDVFIAQISDVLKEWDDFWDAREDMLRAFESIHQDRLERYKPGQRVPPRIDDESLPRVLTQIQALKDLLVEFNGFRQRAATLREGLFNASSVIESRASTRLGENVKLLTYVSIFFLPLAFCVAVWSVNETYDTSSLAITATVVSVATYFIVANLQNGTSILSRFYNQLRKRVVRKMTEYHPSNKEETIWVARGKAFSSFRPERTKEQPSEWYVLYFFLVKIIPQVITFRPWKKNLGQGASRDAEGSEALPPGGETSPKAEEESHTEIFMV
ncbi:hypothetical protein B0H63DRAFT_84346 [Podospora didyma]|uniref:Uncharacterized protein n=1 Tax=Podospora didyma TaxID=330526 RepID=A0AAE0K0B3_9PEZI|nr:hypothetical protein B0H63DRAFT_84346 [Podospora didyma]